MQRYFQANILTTDILLMDVIAKVDNNPALNALIDEFNLVPDTKREIDYNTMQSFLLTFRQYEVEWQPGGSASNTTRTLAKLMNGLVRTKFVGVLGNEDWADPIMPAFHEANVNLLCDLPESNVITPETAISFVVVFPNGKRAIATYPGNARQIISPEMFPEKLVAESDFVFLQGSARKKFNPAVVDRILNHRWNHNKKLILALPTSAFQPDYFEWVIPSANILFSNTDELRHIIKSDSTEDALRKLQRLQNAWSHILTEKGFHPQIAMITDGLNGAFIVTPLRDEILHAPICPLPRAIVNNLGSGDTSYAGGLAGLLLGMTLEQTLELAMALAGAKVLHNGPVMPNPLEGLSEVSSPLAEKIKRDISKRSPLSTAPALA